MTSPTVLAWPFWLKQSFKETGSPSSGLGAMPAARRRSFSRAVVVGDSSIDSLSHTVDGCREAVLYFPRCDVYLQVMFVIFVGRAMSGRTAFRTYPTFGAWRFQRRGVGKVQSASCRNAHELHCRMIVAVFLLRSGLRHPDRSGRLR